MDGSHIRRKKFPFSKVPGYLWTGSLESIFENPPFLVPENAGYVWTLAVFFVLENTRLRVDGVGMLHIL